jgi:hypothetical protein
VSPLFFLDVPLTPLDSLNINRRAARFNLPFSTLSMTVSTLFDDRIEGGENLGGMELFFRWG